MLGSEPLWSRFGDRDREQDLSSESRLNYCIRFLFRRLYSLKVIAGSLSSSVVAAADEIKFLGSTDE